VKADRILDRPVGRGRRQHDRRLDHPSHRCRKTISLSESLAKDGYDVWTPIETKIERAGPSRRRVEVRRAIMPSYVFAGSAHLIDLLQLAQMR
jgi:hypothetical protein